MLRSRTMPTDKTNGFLTRLANSSSTSSRDEQNTVATAEIKTRVEAASPRINSEASMSEMSEMNSLKVSKRGSDASQTYGETTDSSLAGLPNTPAGYNIKSVTAELEKRRAELIALARAAEAKAHEAEEKCEQAETKLEQEANQRRMAEQRLRELEEERLRQLQTEEIEGAKSIEAALANEEVEARLKEAEDRVKEAENKARALTLELAEADRKKAEAEALAQVARDDAREIESHFAEAEARLKDVESRLMEAETRVREETEARRLAEKVLLETEDKNETASLALAEAEAATIALAEANQRRAEAEAIAQAAEAIAQAAEEKCEQAEIRLAQEIDQRSLVEQRLREVEEEYLGQQQAGEIEELKLYDAVRASEGMEARLKDVESRLIEAETRVREETEARRLTEKALLETVDSDEAAALALAEANQKRTEAEAIAQAAEEKARKIEELFIEAEAAAHEAKDRYIAAETELQSEVKQRALAEQKLKDFEDELSSYLELDWSKNEPEAPQVGAAPAGIETNEPASHLLAQIEAEQNARREAENAREAIELRLWEMEKALHSANAPTSQFLAQIEAEQDARREAENAREAIELRLWEMEKALRDAEEKRRQQENELKELSRKQEAKPRFAPERSTPAESRFTSLNLMSSGDDHVYRVTEQKGLGLKLKFIIYGVVVTLLLVAAGWLIRAAFLQM